LSRLPRAVSLRRPGGRAVNPAWPLVKNVPDTLLFGRLPPQVGAMPVTARLHPVRLLGAFTTFRQPP
jgi:hypothetical protein